MPLSVSLSRSVSMDYSLAWILWLSWSSFGILRDRGSQSPYHHHYHFGEHPLRDTSSFPPTTQAPSTPRTNSGPHLGRTVPGEARLGSIRTIICFVFCFCQLNRIIMHRRHGYVRMPLTHTGWLLSCLFLANQIPSILCPIFLSHDQAPTNLSLKSPGESQN